MSVFKKSGERFLARLFKHKQVEKLAEELAHTYADEMVKKIVLPCTACRYCVSHCPQGLDIPTLLAFYNEHCFTGGGV